MTWFANDDAVEYLFAKDNTKVSLWPHSETVRIDPRFRLINGEAKPAPRGSQYFVRFKIDDGPPAVFKNCLVPLLPIGDQELEGSSGVSTDGFEFILRIKSWVTPDPVFSVFGFESHITYKHAGFPDFFVRQMYGTTDPASAPTLALKVELPKWFETMGPFWFSSDYDPLVNTDVNVAIMQNNWFHWPLSECIDLTPVAPQGMAEFNGTSSTYLLDTFNTGSPARWRFEYDIKAQSAAEIVVLGFSGSALVLQNWSGRFCAWRSFIVDTGSALPIGTWVHIDFDYEWDLAGSNLMRVFKDGVPSGTALNLATIAAGDQFGKKGATITGFFDLKQFKLLKGGVAAPTVEIECPMDVDACDLGPYLLGGTTFDMTLPSCPP